MLNGASSVGRRPHHVRKGLDPSHQQQHQQDDNDQAETAAGSVAPLAAVAPRRQGADQQQDQDDQKDEGQGHGVSPFVV